MVKGKQNVVEYDWKEHSSYYTEGEAKNRSTRIMFLLNYPTKVVQDERTKKWWVMIGCLPRVRQINATLDVI